MTAYIVMFVDCRCSIVKGMFSTRELAQTYIDKEVAVGGEGVREWVEIQEWQIDERATWVPFWKYGAMICVEDGECEYSVPVYEFHPPTWQPPATVGEPLKGDLGLSWIRTVSYVSHEHALSLAEGARGAELRKRAAS